MIKLRHRHLPTSVMIELEDSLSESVLQKLDAGMGDEDLAKKFNLEVMSVDDSKMECDIEAELASPIHDGYNGVIRIRESLYPSPFAFTHEIMHYVFDVGVGNVVEKTFARKMKGVAKSDHEQRIDYRAAANRMRYDKMIVEIARYDHSSPKMNPVAFVNHLCAAYKVDNTSAIRRVQEVRAIQKKKKASYSG